MSAVKSPACKPSKTIWLEVAGKKCLDGHQYILSEGAAKIPLETTAKYKGRRGPIQCAEVEKSATRSLFMVLEGDEKITVPLIENEEIAPTKIKPPQQSYQDNLMVPIHPTLFCDPGDLMYKRTRHHYNEVLQAPMRTGWIYVFFRGKLWRELLVKSAEDSAPLMRDTALASARKSAPDFQNDRKPVGPEIDTLHLPAYLLGQAVYDKIELAFSETQWAWQHVIALEENAALRTQRCQKANDIGQIINFQMPKSSSGWSLVDKLLPMRARDNEIERDIGLPREWLVDVDGSRTQQKQDELIAQRDAIESEAYSVDADMFISQTETMPRWRYAHHKGETLPVIQPGSDVYESLRQRHLATLMLQDPLYEARHLVQHINQSLILMMELAGAIKKRKHGTTADLFHQHFRHKVLADGSANPLYTEDQGFWDDRLDDSDEGLLLRTLYSVERAALRKLMLSFQEALVGLLESEKTGNLTAVLRDLFNLEAGSDIAGYAQVSPMLQVLSLPVGQIDPKMRPQDFDQAYGDGAEALNQKLLTGEHPLAGMLFPYKSGEDLLPGDATDQKVKAALAALADKKTNLRALEANAVREIADHLEKTGDPSTEETVLDARIGAHAFYGPLNDVGKWWLDGFQKNLNEKGVTFSQQISATKAGFEKFAGAAVSGRTTIDIIDGNVAKPHVFINVVDKEGNVLTSAAKASDYLKVADEKSFKELAKTRPLGYLHRAVNSHVGIPPLLVIFDIYNLVNALNAQHNSVRYHAGWISAGADLVASTGQWISVFPNQSGFVAGHVNAWSQKAEWFSSMADHINSDKAIAKEIVRSQLQALGWVAGMLTTSLFIWDAAANLFNGRLNMASANLTKAAGTGMITSSDLIAARILTPLGQSIVRRGTDQAAARAMAYELATLVRWGGTVTSAWVTVLGIVFYAVGEYLYYQIKDDAISVWLRSGPFSGDEDDQLPELKDESKSYLALIKTMTRVTLKRLTGNDMQSFFKANDDLSMWADFAESIVLFSTPAFALTSQTPEVTLKLKYQQWFYENVDSQEVIEGRKSPKKVFRTGRITPVTAKFLSPQTMAFVLVEDSLPIKKPQSESDRLLTKYAVDKLELTYSIKAWDRHHESYEIQSITETLTDVDIDNNV